MATEHRDTSIATLHRIRPDYLEVIYKPRCVLSTRALAEVGHARRELMDRSGYGALSLIPEDADFEMSAMHVDHFATDREQGTLLAMAVVAYGYMIEVMLRSYFSSYPGLKRILVSDSEAAARTWLRQQFAEIAQEAR